MLALLLAVATALAANPTVRVATWNIEGLGTPGSTGYEAVLDIVDRIDADVLAINEVASTADVTNLQSLATAAGYPYVVVTGYTTFGAQRNAVLSRLPLLDQDTLTAPALSGDAAANDLSRQVARVVVDMPGTPDDLTLVTTHWKSGTGDVNEFRRVVDTFRVTQALEGLDPATDAFLVVGDMNEIWSGYKASPATFAALPSGLPSAYVLGADAKAELAATLDNDPFEALEALGMAPLDAIQADGSDATRPSSGRRIDYLWASASLLDQGYVAQVYDSADEALAGDLTWSGTALPASTSTSAADHLPVVADLSLPDPTLSAADLLAGDLVISEVMVNPATCSDAYGEWLEVWNASGSPVDLYGIVLKDLDGYSGAVSSSYVLAAGDRAVLGKGSASTWCGTFVPDAFYGTRPALDNTGDRVGLYSPAGLTIDLTPTWTSSNATSGIAWSLDEARLDASDNDASSHWCNATNSLGAEKGTPGSANGTCR